MKINTIQPSMIPELKTGGANKVDQNQGQGSFQQLLGDAIDHVNQSQSAANRAIDDLVMGRDRDLHKTIISMEKASVAFELMMQVRNKIIDAYEEIARMQI
jgi:flagellar hook-basal body complex protein FliE